jgi:hypothetical protein
MGKNCLYIGFEVPIWEQSKEPGRNRVYVLPDPYPAQNLFFRSDNATLAELGVPAHTISTSKMDSEPSTIKCPTR